MLVPSRRAHLPRAQIESVVGHLTRLKQGKKALSEKQPIPEEIPLTPQDWKA